VDLKKKSAGGRIKKESWGDYGRGRLGKDVERELGV